MIMRRALKPLEGVRTTFRGTVAQFGMKSGYTGRDLPISFHARVTCYEKGYKGYREDVYKPMKIDYRLSNPTKMSKIASASDSTTLSTRSPEMGQGVERE